ncbi:BTAD domain-containing putative transcriptional regulator [Streptosporangium saharense]|uniref:BTAD domain-containing putative transcriptional regulator n=1 Tax=Streptosporangium saharense TaxID=1706840 RepID=UPI003443D1F0
MKFLVLGTLEVWDDQNRVTLPSTRHQRVLATLLLTPGAVVPVSKLVEATWDDEPPATATKQVQNCVSALRGRLGDAGGRVIATDGRGYRVVVTEDQLDLLCFTRRIATARARAAAGELAEAVLEMRSALRLWRGPALDGLDTAALTARARRLDEQRLDALEQCVDWQLALGEHREVADELVELIIEHPLRERPYTQLMLALTRCGRQAEAIEVFHRLRARLAEECGIDPGAEARELYERVLRGEVDLSPPVPTALKPGPTPDPRPEPAVPEPHRIDRATQELVIAITRQWRAEAEVRSLNRPEPVPLRWSETRRQVAAVVAAMSDGQSAEDPDRPMSSGGLTDLLTRFRQVPARQLVVLGGPGAGKSVLAILFTLSLLADHQPGEPVPVLFSLASWNPHREHIHCWLARMLVREYPGLANTTVYGRDVATRLVVENRVLPVLDGLDETPPGLRAAAIDALDRAMAGDRPLVVTCRSEEYELAADQAGTILARAAVVEIEPVALEDAVDFLTARRRVGEERWQPVIDHLRRYPDSALARSLRTPLMIDLARTAYAHPSTTPTELCDPARFGDQAAIEGHLLDAYLPAVYAPRPEPPLRHERSVPARAYDVDHAERWLAFLARHLNRTRTHDLAWWRLDRAVRRPVGGLLLGMPAALFFWITGWLAGGPLIGLVYGLSFAAAGCGVHTLGRRLEPLRVELRFRSTATRFLCRFGIGVVIGVSLGLGWSLSAGMIGLLATVFGFSVGLHVWLDTPVDVNRVSSPSLVLRNDRIATWAFALSFAVSLGLFYTVAFAFTHEIRFIPVLGGTFDIVVACAGGLASGLSGRFLLGNLGCVAYGLAGTVTGGLIFSRAPSLANALTAGALFGLAGGLTVGLARAWGSFAVVRLWLAARGHIPLHLMRFLDDAHRRGVLRQVGAVYQFRHARLEDRLAARCGVPPTSRDRSD